MIKSPHWVTPAFIRSAYTTKNGGVSVEPYKSFNLGDHVGDNSKHVLQNRALLKEQLNLPQEPQWLTQVHGAQILNLDDNSIPNPSIKEYDASFTTKAGRVCVVMSADCLPLLLCNQEGSAIAAVHCGWRSLAQGIVQKTLALFQEHSDSPVVAWLGSAIGPQAFEVGEEVKDQFRLLCDESAFIQTSTQDGSIRYLANIYKIATSILLKSGLSQNTIYESGHCTYTESETFYSYRRDKVTGRMASLIWIQD